MPRNALAFLVLLAAFALAAGAPAAADAMLDDFHYPYPVERYAFESQGQPVSMAYMDIKPASPNGRTIVLLHGKNFCAATWEGVIPALRDAGYRVVAPDQIGFCKSTKPAVYQYSLHQLAANTHALLQHLRIEKPVVMGHSMGGMLAMRYAIMYPDELSALVLANPIGLEDWKAKGVPFRTVDEWYARALKTTADTIKAYQKATYYSGEWRPDYDRWVDMLAGMYRGEDGKVVAWSQALTSDMIFTQPVVYELGRITAPTLLLIGEHDNTAIGKDRASPEVRKTLGRYAELAQTTKAAIPHATLVTFPDLGHSPQIQAPERFNRELVEGLQKLLH
jgi:pimeloyl-ACP methyl ester carboxylesterase